MDVPAKGNLLGSYFPARYILAFLGFIGMLVVYGLNDNLSLTGGSAKIMFNHTMERMANRGAQEAYDAFHNNLHCLDTRKNLSFHDPDGPLVIYDSNSFSYIYKGYFWGYQGFILIGARKAEIRSAKWVMFIGVAICILTTILTPVFTLGGALPLTIIRIAQGAGTAFSYTAMHVLVAKWAPPTERGVMEALISCGKNLGPAISGAIGTAIAASIGWQAVFYITGFLSTIWCVLWVLLAEDSPQRQRLISLGERNMIVASLGNVIGDKTHPKQPVPFKAVVRSRAFLVLFVSHICSTMGTVSLIVWVPLYMENVLKYDLVYDNLVMILTALFQGVFSVCLSMVLNTLRFKDTLTTTNIRKISNGVATLVPAACVSCVTLFGCNVIAVTVLWALAVIAVGGTYSGILANHIDIAPNYAGSLISYTEFAAGIITGLIYMIAAIIIIFLKVTWNSIFVTTAIINIIQLLVYSCFASSEEQPWNRAPERKDNDGTTSPNNIELTQQTPSSVAQNTST